MKMFTYRVVTNLARNGRHQRPLRRRASHVLARAHQIALDGGGTTVPLVARDPKETPRTNYPAPSPSRKS